MGLWQDGVSGQFNATQTSFNSKSENIAVVSKKSTRIESGYMVPGIYLQHDDKITR